ncbi:hypothetical protein [Herbidospora sp. RD11066]
MTVFTRPCDDGGLEITIKLTAAEADEAPLMAELFDTYLWALGMLRTGSNSRDPGSPPPIPGDWASALHSAERLPARLDGIRVAAIRAFMAAGGNAERLAGVLRTDPFEARRRWTELKKQPPSDWERWAHGES